MSWSAGEYILLITGVLFLVIVGLSFRPRFVLSPASRAVFAMGALVMGGLAPVLALIGSIKYPPLVWLLPLVPATILGVLIRDARRGSPQTPDLASLPLQPPGDVDAPRRAAFIPPVDASASVGEGGDGRAREQAGSPSATAQELADIAFSQPQLRATIAANPATPANVLDWLASHNDPVVNAAIAARATGWAGVGVAHES